MSESTQPPGSTEALLNIAEHHRQHERYYVLRYLEHAHLLRTGVTTLRTLSQRWSAVEVSAGSTEYQDPRFKMAGCPDLNVLIGIPSIGVLFMEGEGTPRELLLLRRDIESVLRDHEQMDSWLTEKMRAAWERDFQLPDDASWRRAATRHQVLITTTWAGRHSGLVADILRQALSLFDRLDLTPAGIRENLRLSAVKVATVAELLDSAANLVAECSVLLSRNDRGWGRYLEMIEIGS
ncbi:hypothetical protein [Micromonospora radicis]|uniref:Uncharacterized protein n=1 Tax=Micromonospora radicis TaxID=1894971 RepID=A0A418MYE2_9ACTN|nr:hypothetical protein [Micromonospora radicis]RIV40018.1 hypothetical protein D2L64_06765 [Micromonospora radicis]